jgi:hypothetical protein
VKTEKMVILSLVMLSFFAPPLWGRASIHPGSSIHDVEVSNVVVNATVYRIEPSYIAYIYSGTTWTTFVTVKNNGDYTETFNITYGFSASGRSTDIGAFKNIVLAAKDQTTRSYNHTFNYEPGELLVPYAYVNPSIPNDANTTNDWYYSSWFICISNPNPQIWWTSAVATVGQGVDAQVKYVVHFDDSITNLDDGAYVSWGPDNWHLDQMYYHNSSYSELYLQQNLIDAWGNKYKGYIWAKASAHDKAEDNSPGHPVSCTAAVYVYLGSVGGLVVPTDYLDLFAPYIGLASTITVSTAATAIYIKRSKRREEKRSNEHC